MFGHDAATFDPQHDPVVRIEAAKLRRSLERYYLTAGRQDRSRIGLPKGTYVPILEGRADPLAAPPVLPLAGDQPAAAAAPPAPGQAGWPRRRLTAGGPATPSAPCWR